jgi:hypothetical protein
MSEVRIQIALEGILFASRGALCAFFSEHGLEKCAHVAAGLFFFELSLLNFARWLYNFLFFSFLDGLRWLSACFFFFEWRRVLTDLVSASIRRWVHNYRKGIKGENYNQVQVFCTKDLKIDRKNMIKSLPFTVGRTTSRCLSPPASPLGAGVTNDVTLRLKKIDPPQEEAAARGEHMLEHGEAIPLAEDSGT